MLSLEGCDPEMLYHSNSTLEEQHNLELLQHQPSGHLATVEQHNLKILKLLRGMGSTLGELFIIELKSKKQNDSLLVPPKKALAKIERR